MGDLTDRCEQQAEMILCHGFKATHNLLLDCASEIKRLRGYLNEIADTLERDGRFAATVAAIRENLALEDDE